MTLQEQLRKLTTGGPGVTHIASETLFEDCAKLLDRFEQVLTEMERPSVIKAAIRAAGDPDMEWWDKGWTAAVKRMRACFPVYQHAHVGSPTIDRGETCLKCGKDMHDPVHLQAKPAGESGGR